MNKFELAGIGLAILAFVVGAIAYPMMPDRMVTHWDENGIANGSMDKFWGVFLLPVIIAFMEGLFLVIPRIDPLKANIAKFRNEFGWFVVGIMLFMLVIYKQMLLWNLGILINPAQTFPILIAFLFYIVGVLCEKSKRNWFIGVRTPWTMSSDRIWDKTNRLVGRLFKWAALISAVGVFMGGYAIWFVLIPALAIAAYGFIYSYIEFQNEKRGKSKAKTGSKENTAVTKSKWELPAMNPNTVFIGLSTGVTSGIVSSTYFAASMGTLWWTVLLVAALFVMTTITIFVLTGKKYNAKIILILSAVIAIVVGLSLSWLISTQKSDCTKATDEIKGIFQNFSNPTPAPTLCVNNCSCSCLIPQATLKPIPISNTSR